MSAQNISYNFSAVLSPAGGSVSPKTCVVGTASGWVVASSANLAGGLVPQAMATSAGNAGQSITIQHTGIIPGVLGAGALTYATVDAGGLIQRTVTPGPTDLVVGTVYANGDVGLSFPGRYIAAGGSTTGSLVSSTSFIPGQAFRSSKTSAGRANDVVANHRTHEFTGVALANISPGAAGAFQTTGLVDPTIFNLGAGVRCAVGVDVSGNPVRATDVACVSDPNWLGTCDELGTITIAPRRDTVYNVLDFGAVADSDTLYGFKDPAVPSFVEATDNRAAFLAAYAAMERSGFGATIYVPAGNYYCNGTLSFTGTVPVRLLGAHGDGQGSNNPSVLVFPAFNFRNNVKTKGSCLVFNPVGSSVEYIQVTQPASQFPGPWTNPLFLETKDTFVHPAEGSYGYVLHGQDNVPGIAMGAQPVLPREWDILVPCAVNDEFIVCGILDALNPNGVPWRYRVTAVAGDARTTLDSGFFPEIGAAEPFVPGAVYNVGDSVRPTNANWNERYFVVTAGSGSVAVEPTWPPNKSDTVTASGVTFQAGGKMWPRSPGLSMTDELSGNVTVQLVDSTGTLTTNAATANEITWEILAPVDGVRFNSTGRLKDLFVYQVHGNGVTMHAGVGVPGDGWRADRVIITKVSNHGWFERGGDISAGHGMQVIISGAANTYIFADSFLGSVYEACEIAPEDPLHPGRFGYRSTAGNAKNTFIGCYSEGTAPPSRFRGPATMIAPQGNFKLTPDSFVSVVGGYNGWTPHAIQSRAQVEWAALTRVYAGDIVTPVPDNGKRYAVDSVTGDSTTGVTQPTAFYTHLATLDTFTETTGTGSVTYKNQGPSHSQTLIGAPALPEFMLEVSSDDIPGWSGGIGGSLPVPYAISFMANSPADGWYGWTRNRVNTSAILAFDFKNFQAWLTCPLVFGYGGSYKTWYPQGNDTLPTTTGNNVGDAYWFSSGAATSGYVGCVLYAQGSPDTYRYFGKLLDPAEELFVQPRIRWSGGTGLNSTALPNTDSVRDSATRTDATPTTIHTYTPVDGAVVTVTWKVVAKQTAGTGNPKANVWTFTGSWRRIGSALVVVDALVSTAGSANDAGATCALTVSSQNLVLTFTGEASKTWESRLVREAVESI